ncbi:MAG: DNA mismatch repair protein MutT [Pseudopedobacter saltans]|uniref:DNA mismatch repair protein MutT n=1 Tax=Pseudopedobacter saltans TaxID=151895 RepID=A0A2W5GNB6_9SPHI|nr:MAG: DNA mismatch repair protein MutT [Pseudopedobacter saltans]
METNSKILPTAGLVVCKNNRLLLVYSKKKQAWYLPGGKLDAGETSLQAVIRECKEELNIDLQQDRLQYYCHTTAPAYGEHGNTIMEQDCYLYELDEDIKPSNEIEDARFYAYEEYLSEKAQVIGVLKIFEQLRKDAILQY